MRLEGKNAHLPPTRLEDLAIAVAAGQFHNFFLRFYQLIHVTQISFKKSTNYP